jgi:hypothetical protein
MKINMRFYAYLDRDLRGIRRTERFCIQVAEKYKTRLMSNTCCPLSPMVFEMRCRVYIPEIVYSTINSGLPNI